jgi:lipid II:glycine glycyltransferase (peptidoglycan interpeptide bridge formation enzyme)
MSAIGWKVEKVSGIFIYVRKFPLIGNFIKIQRPLTIEVKLIQEIIHKYKPFQMVIEPNKIIQVTEIKKLGFKQSKTYFVPSKTIQIDLTKTESQLLKEMHYKTRYNIHKITNYELRITKSKDIVSFADFWQICARDRGMYLSLKKEIIEIYNAFGENAQIILVKKGDATLSAILLILTKDTAYYMYAASSNNGKKTFGPTVAAWEAIRLSKKLKKKIFDFEGIYDERFPIKSWLGFTRFKRSFGGKEVEYPGTYSKFMLPFGK